MDRFLFGRRIKLDTQTLLAAQVATRDPRGMRLAASMSGMDLLDLA